MARPKEYDENEVVAKAVELFRRQGYEATSVRDLQESTGLSSSSLYAAFGGKEALYLAALRAHAEVERGQLLAQLGAPGGIRANVRAVFDSLVDQLVAPGQGASLTLRAAIEVAASKPQVFTFLSGYIQELTSMFANLLEDAQRRGDLQLRFPAPDLARYLLFSAYNLGFVAKVDRSRQGLEGYAAIVLTALEPASKADA